MAETSEILTPPIPGLNLPEPVRSEQTGVDFGILLDLVLKVVYYTGRPSSRQLTRRLGLSFGVVEELLTFLRRQEYVEIVGSAGMNEPDYQYALTSKSRNKTQEVLDINQYVGPAPVSLDAYVEAVARQSVSNVRFEQEDVERALSHLVLPLATKEQIGTAIGSGSSLFLYGAPGNGKTEIAQSIGAVLGGDPIVVPYAIEVYGQIVRIHDPRLHLPAGASPDWNPDSDADEDEMLPPRPQPEGFDRRWAITRRPLVSAGGEMTVDDLELRFSPTSKFYAASLQLKANGGVLVIDDFGRQRMRPDELLNRWMVPMDRRVDHLTFQTGETIQVPFDSLLVFSTNLTPSELGDEAFFRRIRHKVRISDPDEASFRLILRAAAAKLEVAYSSDGEDYLLRTYYQGGLRPMRGVHPRDIINHIRDLAKYRNLEPNFSRDWIDAACASYFVDE